MSFYKNTSNIIHINETTDSPIEDVHLKAFGDDEIFATKIFKPGDIIHFTDVNQKSYVIECKVVKDYRKSQCSGCVFEFKSILGKYQCPYCQRNETDGMTNDINFKEIKL